MRHPRLFPLFLLLPLLCARLVAGDAPPGVVSHIKVVSDKVEDVTTLADWKKAYIKDGMSDHDKAIAIWKSVVKYRHQTNPPQEGVQNGGCAHDPMKTIHVYGYGQCCCASSNIEGLGRYIGMGARGRIINSHSVPEVQYDGEWHLLDASVMNYFTRPDGKIASVDDIRKAVRGWWEAHPESAAMRGKDSELHKYAMNDGWKRGPELLLTATTFDINGINPAGWHGWPSNMQEYDWSDEKCAVFEYGPSMGYELNIQLRPGEKLTRNWSNKLLIVPGDGSKKESIYHGDRKPLGLQTKFGDIAPGRVGNGTLAYVVPVAGGAYRSGALSADNLSPSGALRVADAANPGVLIIRNPCSYLYHTGTIEGTAVIGNGGKIAVSLSDDNGHSWKPVGEPIAQSGAMKLDLSAMVYRRYDYRVKFEFSGAGTGLDALSFTHDIQHAQTPLPALLEGKNTITFQAGAAEGTITYEGNMNPAEAEKRKVVNAMAYEPKLTGVTPALLRVGETGSGEAVWTADAPGEITRVRYNAHWRARDAKDGFELQLSFDDGKTFKKVDDFGKANPAETKYATYGDVPAGTKRVLLKQIFRQRNTTCVFDQRIDVDFKEPAGGFRPVKVTYQWEEGGQAKENVHVCAKPDETFEVTCGPKPLMKSIVLELAE
jgi:hypothetical protein